MHLDKYVTIGMQAMTHQRKLSDLTTYKLRSTLSRTYVREWMRNTSFGSAYIGDVVVMGAISPLEFFRPGPNEIVARWGGLPDEEN